MEKGSVAVFSLRRCIPVGSVVGHMFGNLVQKDVCVTIHDKIALGNRTLPCRLVCLAQTLAIRDIGVFSRANIAMVNEVHRSILEWLSHLVAQSASKP